MKIDFLGKQFEGVPYHSNGKVLEKRLKSESYPHNTLYSYLCKHRRSVRKSVQKLFPRLIEIENVPQSS